jgi:FSR family fosmidomycin resistance protein-like MFS transporter
VDTKTFIFLVIFYNVFAFGLQALFGLAADHLKAPRKVALLGCVLTAFSAITFIYSPILAIVFAGLGNALFHVGGGSISLNLTPKKAFAPGVFVAPGALGLLVGTIVGKNGQFIAWPFILILAALCLLMFIVKKPEMNYEREYVGENKFNYLKIILALVFLSVAIRSLVGAVLVFPWKTDLDLLVILTLAIVLGKGLGGVLADRFGWIRVAVGALLLSIPFLVFGANIPYLAIMGMFLFNITMPITMVAISNILPGRPGFAFGLTCLALIIGVLPSFTGLKQILGGELSVAAVIIISSLALFYGLRNYFINYKETQIAD